MTDDTVIIFNTDNYNNLSRGDTMDIMQRPPLKDGEPCGHTGCLNHATHPCEKCGRIAGERIDLFYEWFEANKQSIGGVTKRQKALMRKAFRAGYINCEEGC